MATDVPEWVHLTDEEDLLWSGHPSLRPVVPALAVGLGLIVAGFLLALLASPVPFLPPSLWFVPLVLVPVGLLIVARWYLPRWAVRYTITSEEVYRKTGILSRDVTQLRLDRVQNTQLSQSFVERLLSYGDIRIDTAGTGGTELVFEGIDRPQEVNAILTEQLDEVGVGGGIGSRPRS
ncbi:hypothetical protein BRC77_08560 [Halobacteriales archaeon QH_8_64_26]|jgi:uncharacterized membrane protein YdbT with pleckstrin-like domain|nr:MAG: hypothetical protein BRC77_08560 [Halobacteriales archaeon QH_8_64_26]